MQRRTHEPNVMGNDRVEWAGTCSLGPLPPVEPVCRRFWLIVLDGLGIGQPEVGGAWADDQGADTFASVEQAADGLDLPNLARLGLRPLLAGLAGATDAWAQGSSARLIPLSLGKDTLTGHWELAGIVTDQLMRTFPDGLPQALLDRLAAAFGRGVLGGMPASGTAVIDRYGTAHLRTGKPIIYTSADSVIQIAAHIDVIAKEELYRLCALAREVAQGEWLVGRVIARPFYGEPGRFRRDGAGRRDYSVIPPGPTVLDAAFDAGIEVVAIGKINDIFGGRGISRSIKASGNDAVIQALDELRSSVPERRQIIFANLNDFDSLYGHRRDAVGFGAALEHFDAALASLLPSTATGEEIMAITADHGCDPGHAGSDHTRETVPLFVAGASWPPACLGTVEGLTAVAGLIAGGFGLQGFNFWSRKTITSVG